MIIDSLINLITGLGTSKDKKTFNNYVFAPSSFGDLSNAYRSEWSVRKIIDIPPYDATREWRKWIASREQITLIEKYEESLKIRKKINEAMKKARLYGGSVILLGVGDIKDWSNRLEYDSLSKGSLRYCHVFDRTEISSGEIERNVESEYFGLPKYYVVPHNAVRIHPSRVIRFTGNDLPSRSLEADGWSDSIIYSMEDAIKDASSVISGISTLATELSVDVIKIPGFMANISSKEYETLLIERFALAHKAKSMVNALMLDAEETWERSAVNFAGLPELIRTYLGILSSASDIPATRFLGESPGGLNATGESDIRNYYDSVSSTQKNIIEPELKIFDEVLIRSALGYRPEDVYFEWRPLWQLDESQMAESLVKKSAAISSLKSLGFLNNEFLSEGVDNMVVESGILPGYESALLRAAQASVQAQQGASPVEPVPLVTPAASTP